MSSDRANSTVIDDDAAQINATWQSANRRRDDIERAALVTNIASALDGSPIAMLDVAAAAAVFGAAWARSGRTLNGLVEDLDLLEGIWLDHICGCEPATRTGDANDPRASARRLHSISTTARQSAIAAFAHASASATKKRVRLARHDILNAIGAVRNGVLLMDDQPSDAKKAHLRGIATRNSFTAEMLVRLHLSDAACLTAALGWQEIGSWEHPDCMDAPSGQLRAAANTGALDAIVRSVHRASRSERAPHSNRGTIAISATTPDVGLLTLGTAPSADDVDDSHVVETVRRLAAAMGLTLEDGSNPRQLRILFPLSAGDQRHDLGGAGQGYNGDSVRL
jgi:hypothetical protein